MSKFRSDSIRSMGGGVVVKALGYKQAGHGFDSDGVIGIFQ
jgi:hypothetical protein